MCSTSNRWSSGARSLRKIWISSSTPIRRMRRWHIFGTISWLTTSSRRSPRRRPRRASPRHAGDPRARRDEHRVRIGGFDMDKARRQELIDQYKDGYRVVTEALAGASDADLDSRPAPGKWTPREIVHHLADSEMTSAIRLRLLVTGPKAIITG